MAPTNAAHASYGGRRILITGGAETPVVHGSIDTDVTPDHAATTFPGAERVVIDGGTQLSLRTHPDAAETRKRAAALLGAPHG